MNEDRMRILRVLEEGKINADEAARLLKALGEEQEQPKEPADEFSDFFEHAFRGARPHDGMPHVAKGPWPRPMRDWAHEEDPFQAGFDTTPQSVAAKEGMTLQVHSAMGAINLVGTEDSEIVVEGGPRRHYRIEEQGNTVTVHAHRMGANMTVRVPTVVDKVIVHTDLGEIKAQNLGNDDIQLATDTGGIVYEAGEVKVGAMRLRSDVGTIMLRLPKDAACEIRAACDGQGEVSVDPSAPLEVVEQGTGFLHGKMNGGGADIRVVTDTGDIHIGVRD